jgi:HD-GYP domain-containing protein (c-di-GMP phosphodiesterase class II)
MATPAPLSVPRWMDLWSDLETRLSVLLLRPRAQTGFVEALEGILGQLTEQLDADADSCLYWLFQVATSSSIGYSTSHATVCASLCHLVAPTLGIAPPQRRSLTLAALTMNLAMTQLQDTLAEQHGEPTPEQRQLIHTHAEWGALALAELGVTDPDWLQTVRRHHDQPEGLDLLTRVLATTDRYAAMLSPRDTRPGRCVTDSARGVIARRGSGVDDVGHALLRTVGICPPGTFVRLEDQRVAVVLRRQAEHSWVTPVLDASGLPIVEPRLLHTGTEGAAIEAALLTATVRVRMNHARMLELSREAARTQA